MFMNAVVGIDGEQGGRDAIALATELGAPGGRITIAHIYGVGLVLHGGWHHLLSPQRDVALERLERERDAASLDAPVVAFLDRSVGRGLHRLAEAELTDLLVIGSCRRSLLGRVLLGSDTLFALNGAPCAVAIAPMGYAARHHEISSIGVGYDGSPESERALAAARELARQHGSRIKVRSVVSLQSVPYGEPIPENWPDIAKQVMDYERGRIRALDDVEGDVSYGEPSEELAQFSEDLDLLIVGSRSYGPLGRLISGSTSNYLAEHGRCPLVVLPRSATKEEEANPRDEAIHTHGDRARRHDPADDGVSADRLAGSRAPIKR